MKALSLILGLVFLIGCGQSRSIRGTTAPVLKKPSTARPTPRTTPMADIRPPEPGIIEKRLDKIKRDMQKLNEDVEEKAEKAGKNFRNRLDKLWQDQDALQEAWKKTKEKSGQALDVAGKGLEAGLEEMEKALKSLREGLE